ncbi:costars family protein ABRACL-like, partial [Clarias magur]
PSSRIYGAPFMVFFFLSCSSVSAAAVSDLLLDIKMNVDHEVMLLVNEIHRLGQR